MSEQPELNFERLAGEGPIVRKFQLDEMIARLRGKGWQTAKDLGARKERTSAIAEASEGQIISGQKGYRLTIEATVTEIAWLKSQGKKMTARWLAIQRVAHPILAGAKS